MHEKQEITIGRLNEVSRNYIQALGGQVDKVREPGLIVSGRDVVAIKRYVTTALELPCELEQIKQLLRYEVADVPGLEPADMQDFYQDVKLHAREWPSIETAMKTVGVDLVVFSDTLKDSGETLIRFIEGLDGFKSAIGVIGDITTDGLEHYPLIELTDRDKGRGPTLMALLENVRSDIHECGQNARQVRSNITAFKNGLKGNIGPTLGLKLALLQRNGKPESLTSLESELDAVNQDIQQHTEIFEGVLDDQYGVFAFIEAMLADDAAPSPRARLQQLFVRKRRLAAQIRHNHALQASLLNLQTDLQDLGLRVSAAASSASNLESLWMLILGYVDASAKRLSHLNDAVFLVVFVARLRSMITCWTEIKGNSQDLLTAFNNAIAEG